MINWLTYNRRTDCQSRIDFSLRTSDGVVRVVLCIKTVILNDSSPNRRISRRFCELKDFNYTLISLVLRGCGRGASALTLPLRFNRVCRRPAWRPFVRGPSVGDTRGPRSALAQTERGTGRDGRMAGRAGTSHLQSVPVWASALTRDTSASSMPTFPLVLLFRSYFFLLSACWCDWLRPFAL